jgi:Rha family phage regulatory protein
MNVIFKDLFPETLLVQNEGGKLTTTSLMVAQHFHKEHRNVVRDIEKLIQDVADTGFSLLNFEQSDFQNQRGKTYKSYKMDQKAFSVLAGRFTGKKALVWQLEYHDAFEAMQTYIDKSQARFGDALNELRPKWRPTLLGDAQGLARKDIILMTGHKSVGGVTAARAAMRKFGLLPAKNGGAA